MVARVVSMVVVVSMVMGVEMVVREPLTPQHLNLGGLA